MIQQDIIDQAKRVSIVAYLQAQGFKKLNTWSQNIRFENPIRKERTSSFDVNEKENLWYDRGEGIGGNIIQLVMKYRQCSFPKAVHELVSQNSFFLRCKSENSNGENSAPLNKGVEIRKIKPLEAKLLLNYLSSRSVNIMIAREYLKEAYFTVNGSKRQQFALAFPNKLADERSGYELRNKIWKSCAGKKYYSVINGADRTAVLMFEGFMDFLSYLTYHSVYKPPYPTIVLNSIETLKDDLLYKLQSFAIHAYLDNDDGGNNAMRRLQNSGLKVIDHRQEYEGYKDFNSFIMNNTKPAIS